MTGTDMLFIDLSIGLRWAADHVEDLNKSKGWYEKNRTFGDEIALLHSEVSEALEAFREYGSQVDVTLDECANKAEHSDDPMHQCKPRGVGSEMADVLVRLLDTCKRYNIDLGAEFAKKMKYNWTRTARHGGKAL